MLSRRDTRSAGPAQTGDEDAEKNNSAQIKKKHSAAVVG